MKKLTFKQLGMYLYKHIDGAYKYEIKSNIFDLYITLYYQLPEYKQIPEKGKEYNDIHEMIINVSITTYSDKIRVNLYEVDPEEMTLGQFILKDDDLIFPEYAKNKILKKIDKALTKRYQEYDFIY